MPSMTEKGWTTVTFGDMAANIVERAEPTLEDSATYVGLEHLDSGSLIVNRWGSRVPLKGPKFRVHKGDILFGRRNAYLRRVAIAPHDGLFSAHGMVLRAKSDVVLPEFLPFFMQSDLFMERAKEISVGSLSPTINWATLAQEEFTLPPIEEQRRIVAITRELDAHVQALDSASRLASQLERATFRDALTGALSGYQGPLKDSKLGRIPIAWDILPISALASVSYGISEAVASNRDPSIGWPILTGANITLAGVLDLSKLVFIKEPKNDSFILKRDDLLLNWRSGSEAHVGKTAVFDLDGDYTYASFLLRIRTDSSSNHRFFWRLLNHMREFRLFGPSTSQQINFKMNAAMFRDVGVVAPPLKEQNLIVDRLQQIWEAQAVISGRMEKVKSLRQCMLEGTE